MRRIVSIVLLLVLLLSFSACDSSSESSGGYRLIVNGEENEAGKYVLVHRHENGYYYTEIPLLAISEALGAKVERQANGLIWIVFNGIAYELNTEEATLVEVGKENIPFIEIAPGSSHGIVHRMVEDEFLIDNTSVDLFTTQVLGVRVILDTEEKTVTVEHYDFSQL